jgi:glycosyltransferase involved in cell wall biosynthesis
MNPDISHWTFPIPIRTKKSTNIYTIHDLVPLRMPYTTLDHKRIYLWTLRAIAKKADHIVTVSEYSRRDIIKYLGVDENRVTNTYEAVDIPDQYLNKPQDVLAAELEGLFRLTPGGYFLFFGAIEPKKNIARILQAYLGANVQMPLVMVLSRSWLAEAEEAFLEKILQEDRERSPGERRRVLRFNYMPFPLLMTLLKGARGIIFPSLYEGFGLPVLEAMTMGTPVITASATSIPEVAGNAALMVDPYDTDALRRAIVTLASDNDLAADLKQRGLKQAQSFSLAVYRERLTALYKGLS